MSKIGHCPGFCTGMKRKEVARTRTSRTNRTVSERPSVTDAAIRPESAGMSGFARQQGGRYKSQVGAHGAGETPVPIPNTEVKPSCGYNTWVLALGK